MTFAQIDQRVRSLYKEIQQKDRLGKLIKETKRSIQNLEEELKEKYIRLNKEYNDIARLEKFSLANLFSEILGNHQERLEQERHEYLLAVLDHRSIQEELEASKFQLNVLLDKRIKLEATEAELSELLRKKEFYLKKVRNVNDDQIRSLDASLRYHDHKCTEIEEAILAGRETLLNLTTLIDTLKKVLDWGYIMDPLYKHKTFGDRALKLASKSKVSLETFESELKDVYSGLHKGNDLNLVVAFLSNFNAYLLTDWILKKKTVNARNECQAKIDYVAMQLLVLEADLEKHMEKRSEIIGKRRTALVFV